MNELHRRMALYGGSVVVLAAIGVAWCNTSRDADVMTLLSSADVQLRMAYSMPKVDSEGQQLDTRKAMITVAVEHLETVERLEPGLAVAAEFRGFAHMLDGQYAEAARCYRDAQRRDDCQDEQRDVLAFNEARMLAKAGSREQALQVFAAHAEVLDARFGHQRILEEATILAELGRRADSKQRLDEVARDPSATSMARLQAGIGYAQLGSIDCAEQQLSSVRGDFPIADYHLAHLKLRRGEVDSCFELLARACNARPAEVRQKLLHEADAWSAVAGDERFQQLSESTAASPGR